MQVHHPHSNRFLPNCSHVCWCLFMLCMVPDIFGSASKPTQASPPALMMKRPALIDLTSGEEAQEEKKRIIMSHIQEMTMPCVAEMLQRCAERGCSKTHVYMCPVVICSKCEPEKKAIMLAAAAEAKKVEAKEEADQKEDPLVQDLPLFSTRVAELLE